LSVGWLQVPVLRVVVWLLSAVAVAAVTPNTVEPLCTAGVPFTVQWITHTSLSDDCCCHPALPPNKLVRYILCLWVMFLLHIFMPVWSCSGSASLPGDQLLPSRSFEPTTPSTCTNASDTFFTNSCLNIPLIITEYSEIIPRSARSHPEGWHVTLPMSKRPSDTVIEG
jgi:hypothetical protein